MIKLSHTFVCLLLAAAIWSCPKEPDIKFEDRVAYLPKDLHCLERILNGAEGVFLGNSEELNNNSISNGFQLSFNTEYSGGFLTVYEEEPERYMCVLESWVKYDATNEQFDETKRMLRNLFLIAKQGCLTHK